MNTNKKTVDEVAKEYRKYLHAPSDTLIRELSSWLYIQVYHELPPNGPVPPSWKMMARSLLRHGEVFYLTELRKTKISTRNKI